MKFVVAMIWRRHLPRKNPQPLSPPLPPTTHSNNRYTRNLLKYVQSDKYEKLHMALKSAPHLIRQKAAFGTKLTDQAGKLARVLTGMQEVKEMRLTGGISIRIKEIIGNYDRLLLGDIISLGSISSAPISLHLK
jgi:Telomere length regulation protein